MLIESPLIIGVALTAWLVTRIYNGRSQAPADLRQRPHRRWRAVTILSHGKGCAGVQAVKGQRFLADDAPPLPLSGCTAEKCRCRYSHHVDRRTGVASRRSLPDRRGVATPRRAISAYARRRDRRHGRGRRLYDQRLPSTFAGTV